MSENVSALFLQNPQAANILRRRALAERLMQSQSPTPMTTPMALYGNIAQQLAGALMGRQADRDAEDFGNQQRAETKDYLQRYNLIGGAPQTQGEAPAAPAAAGGRPGTAPTVPEDLAPHIERASQESGVPVPILNAVYRQESNLGQDPRATANGGGIGQIISSTARNPGYGLPAISDEDRLNPARAIPWSAQYLAARARAAGATDWNNPEHVDRALRAYNGGGDPNYVANVRRHLPGGPGVVLASAPGAPAGAAPAAPMPPGSPNPGIQNMVPRVDLQRAAMEAALSNNPNIQRLAPMVGQLASREQPRPVSVAAGATLYDPVTRQPIFTAPRDDSHMPPTVTMDGPQGPGVYERTANGLRLIGRQTAPQSSERERAQDRYIRLSIAARSRELTPDEQGQLALDAQFLEGSPQVVAGPTGIGYVPSRELPFGTPSAPRPVQGPGAPGTIAIQQPPSGPPPAASGPQAMPIREDATPGVAAPSQRAPQQVQIPGRGTAQFIPAEQPPAQPPTQMASGMLENVNSLRQARAALDAATQRPQSFGLLQGVANLAPGVLERMDPAGVAARAAVGNLSSLVIHDRSGAAVTVAEFPRLRPFIPQVGDPPEVVRTKLERFVSEYEAVLRDQYSAYGPAAGYRPLDPVEEILRAGRIAGPGGQGTAEPPPGGSTGTRRPLSAFQR